MISVPGHNRIDGIDPREQLFLVWSLEEVLGLVRRVQSKNQVITHHLEDKTQIYETYLRKLIKTVCYEIINFES